ncbi:hypothetical protein [Soonwooa sp.]|uniref:ATP-grasp domain-containing protein n=1 Tax=Soonwooa sp. TaxID=1938592 RepID=UPI0026047EAC|nr:hypothetical protein [Soonwooa sp.]
MNNNKKVKIALASYKTQQHFNNGVQHDEDEDLLNYLRSKSEDVTKEIWNDEQVNWEQYDIVIVKSTWDYHIHLSEFLDWLTHLESLGIMVKNNAKTIRWNSDKIYLKEIADSGLPVVSSIFSETFDEVETSFEQLNTQEIVVKPRISAGAKDTFKVKRSEFSQHKNEIEKLMATTPIIVQPFVKEIADGEWSFLFFGGNYSHSLLKTPKEKDFRVQHYWGGSVSTPQISGDIIEKSIQPYVSKFASDTLYARVDGVFIDGIFHLMELELIEPYLFLSTSENSFENYYQALLKVKSAL